MFLALTLVLPLTAAGAGASYPDTEHDWAAEAINRWSDYQIVTGFEDGTFRPSASVTRAEAAAILSRLLFLQERSELSCSDVQETDWAYDSLAKCAAAGILEITDGKCTPTAPLTRQEAVIMLARALKVSTEAAGAERFTDSARISPQARGFVNAFANHGYLHGYTDGSFRPNASISRAEFLTILDNMVGYYFNEPGSYTLTGNQIAIVNSGNVTLDQCDFSGIILETPLAKYDSSLVAAARTGTYIGQDNGQGIVSYKGIRFAQAERWQTAELVADSTDLYEAYTYGPAAYQDPDFGWNTLLPAGVSEDCLNLNLYTNSTSTSDKKAVMVWVCGGANQVGSNVGYEGEEYDGTTLVTENPDVILVAINYRAGVFGTLDLSSLEGYDEETYRYSNNLARLDIQTALQWINGNISAFGGDPDNVTVFGYSFGSANSTALLLMESAHPYFDKVIGQSSVSVDNNFGFITMDDAAEAACTFFEATGVKTMEDALALTSEEVLAGSAAVANMNFSELTQFGTYTNSDAKIFSPVCDGIVLPLDPDQAYLDGIAREKKIMIGTTYGEYDPNMARAGISEDMDACRQYVLDRNLNKLTGKHDLIDRYVSNYSDERSSFNAYRDLMCDMYQRVPVALLATVQSLYNDVYLYNYNWMPEGSTNRAPHGAEVLAIFDQDDAIPENLQLAMRKAWCNFALYGDPNNEYLGTEWKPYNYNDRYTMMLEEKCRLVDGLRRDDFDLLIPLFDLFEDVEQLLSDKSAIVQAKTGTYIGTHDTENGVLSYKGIQYATAERWQLPEIVPNSEAYRLATQFGPGPMQNLYNGWGTLCETISEDCLNLNIYTSDDGKTGKPVMVWFYGGAQQCGCNIGYEGEEYDGTALITENPDIIIVTPNYRTGFWGSVDLSVLSGASDTYQYSNNLARMDLLQSLKWIKENISAFGGDPNNVTIFGQSAGSNNITCLMLMEEAQGYFNKAICESSFALDISLTSREAAQIASRAFFKQLGVNTVEEALSKSKEDLLAAQIAIVEGGSASADGSSAFAEVESKLLSPVVDNVVIKDDYWETFLSGKYLKDVKVILGTNEGEYDQQFRRWSDEKDWDQALTFTVEQNWGKLSDRGWNKDYAQQYIDTYLSNYSDERTFSMPAGT